MATPVGTGPIVQDVAPKGGFPKVWSCFFRERTTRLRNSHFSHHSAPLRESGRLPYVLVPWFSF